MLGIKVQNIEPGAPAHTDCFKNLSLCVLVLILHYDTPQHVNTDVGAEQTLKNAPSAKSQFENFLLLSRHF